MNVRNYAAECSPTAPLDRRHRTDRQTERSSTLKFRQSASSLNRLLIVNGKLSLASFVFNFQKKRMLWIINKNRRFLDSFLILLLVLANALMREHSFRHSTPFALFCRHNLSLEISAHGLEHLSSRFCRLNRTDMDFTEIVSGRSFRRQFETVPQGPNALYEALV